jgi:hypothetical protein
MNNVITLKLTKQEAYAVLRALGTANDQICDGRTPDADRAPNSWVAFRLVDLLAE